jgi:shikimate dehydrogenase
MPGAPDPVRRAAVLGRPIRHSLSPVIHNAGYAAAGLRDWSYTAHECGEPELAGFVAGLNPDWAGLSLTMPLKEVALAVADEVTPVAEALGAANTLVRGPRGWLAENTDAPGMVDALAEVSVSTVDTVAVLGAGGTARAALAAAARLGAASVDVYARRAEAVAQLRPVADRLGLGLSHVDFGEAAGCGAADLVISTVPKGVADAVIVDWRPDAVLFDAIYDPWPTPLAAAAQAAGARIVSGLDLLLTQAVHQFRLFTGVPAPVAAMRTALWEAAARR